MNSSEPLDDAPVQDQTLDLAVRLPGTLISAAAGASEDAIRAPGLILTKEQLVELKRYETLGLALPTELNDVIFYLGYETGAGPYLEARDFQTTFNHINQHALRWNPLRTDLMNVGSELWVFADQMLVYAAGVRRLYNEIKTKPSETADPEAQADFLQYIEQVASLVLQRRNVTEALKRRLKAFAEELSTAVMPEVKLKLRSIDTSNLPTGIQSLIDTLERGGADIEAKQLEYKALVKKSAADSIGLPQLSLYRSSDADKVRKQISALRQQQEASIVLLEQKNRIHASLHRVRSELHDLTLVLVDADIATQNLTDVWNGLHTYLTYSVQEAGRIDSVLSLRRLFNAFNLVAKPWGQIKQDADTLLNVFKEADREFRMSHGHQ